MAIAQDTSVRPGSGKEEGAYLADTAQTLFLEGPSGRFGYRRMGPRKGTPLVLLNRFRGTLDWWDPLFVDYLATEHDVITVDHLGVGYSSGEPRDTVQAMADGALEFLEGLGLDQADLLGWSLGGMVAQHVALKRPALVRRLVVAGSTAGGQTPGAPPPAEQAQAIMAKPKTTLDDVVALFFPQTDTARALGYDHIARVSRRLTAEAPGVSAQAAAAGMAAIGAFSAAPLEEARANLQALSAPVLFGAGAKDWLIPAIASFFAVEHVGSTGSLVVYGDAGHAFLFQHAKAFTDAVKAFLAA